MGGLGEDVAIQVDLDGARGGEDVDALGGVFGMDVDGCVFFVPLVWWGRGQLRRLMLVERSRHRVLRATTD